MPKKTLLVMTSSIMPAEMARLEEMFDIVRLWKEPDPDAAIRRHQNDIVAAISGIKSGASAQLIEALPNLEIIAQNGVGVDNIDLEAARRRDIKVVNTPDVVTEDTADTALALLLAVTRRVVEGDMFVRAGFWEKRGTLPRGMSLGGKRAGIVGLGRIGRAIARRLQAFGIDVVYTGRNPKDDVDYLFYEDVAAMATDCDFLILSCSGGPETGHLIHTGIFEAMPQHAVLINVARGSVVDEPALVRALKYGEISGAGLDVFADEPYVPEEFKTMDNVVMLPHIGAATRETAASQGQLIIDNLAAHFEGRPLLTPVT